MTAAGTLVVARRFRGPATSGNGGWTCGCLAARLTPDPPGSQSVRVRLSAPPPLDLPLALERFTTADGAAGLRLRDRDRLVAEAHLSDTDPTPVPPLTTDPDRAFALAVEAGHRYPGRVDHPFPTCLACGTGRAEGDGLRLQPGPGDPPDGTTSTAWVPHPAFDSGDGRVDVPTTWAALDCPGGWSADMTGRPMVLGTITARVLRRPAIGERCVVRGVADPSSGRTVSTRSTLYGADGDVLGVAAQIWVVVDPRTFTG
jgi:hypothetical protein